MKFFLDTNIPYSYIEIFEKYGETLHARDVQLQKAQDIEIFKYALDNKAILVTKDLEFGNSTIYEIKLYNGLIIIRLPFYFKAYQIYENLKEFLSSIDIKDVEKSITIIELGRYRIRKI